MKKLVLLISIALLSSCSVMYLPYSSSVYSLDYSKYTKIDFFITESSSVSFGYDPVASVGAKESSGSVKTKTSENKIRDYFKRATADAALDALVYESIRLGADALIGLKVMDISITGHPVYTASGMAVKRK